MSDDHAATAIGCYGGRLAPLYPTPNLDAMAREGTIFRNAFAVNAICTPSRATIRTGRHSHVNGVLDLDGQIEAHQMILPLVMAAFGYRTAMIGKWHLKTEPVPFEHFAVLPGQGLNAAPDPEQNTPRIFPGETAPRWAVATPPGWEFYDLRLDPEETDNRYADPGYRNVIDGLKRELARQRETLGDTDEAYPHIATIVRRHWDD
jgi:arylsulfatase A-like enzyme